MLIGAPLPWKQKVWISNWMVDESNTFSRFSCWYLSEIDEKNLICWLWKLWIFLLTMKQFQPWSGMNFSVCESSFHCEISRFSAGTWYWSIILRYFLSWYSFDVHRNLRFVSKDCLVVLLFWKHSAMKVPSRNFPQRHPTEKVSNSIKGARKRF